MDSVVACSPRTSNARGALQHSVCALLFVLPAWLSGCAQGPEVAPYAQVTSYGLFETRLHPPTRHFLPNPAAGMSSFRLIQQTDRIPAEMGRSFGYCFLIRGLTSYSVVIRQEVEHPPWTQADGTLGTEYSHEDTFKVLNGRTNGCLGHTFDEPKDLVSGVWRVRLSIAGNTLAVKELVIVRPDDL
ncbi:MAG: DUF3859 domain-containing protein [Burkholderiales bacterium]|nr:DUF3859 domain-containing protein [Burkholderiales bacterium]